MHPTKKPSKTKVLLELRPATEGFAGIPQETRLLFSNLSKIPSVHLEGLLQGPTHKVAKGMKQSGIGKVWTRLLKPAARYAKYSNVIISMKERPYLTLLEKWMDWFDKRSEAMALQLSLFTNIGKIKLTSFDPSSFEDFIWRSFFAKTLPPVEFDTITHAPHRICSISWFTLHMAGLGSLNWSFSPKYPKIATQDIDIFIAQTPYPARISKNTKFVVRYHDAIPIFMPHTINDVSSHQATHIHALVSNVKSKAWFACVSESSRQDLLKLFPKITDRVVTIHNSVSHHYFKETTSFERVRGIIRSRIYGFDPEAKGLGVSPEFLNLREQENFFKRHLFDKEFQYLLVVSTIEPRKNHTRVLAAWEILKEEIDPNIKLVIVGTLGWGYTSIVKTLKTWIDRGELFMLNSVPAPDLRVLYNHAAATVCPSLFEGFDFSGVEAMMSGGIAIASDIPVHREIYERAATYFNPYSTMSLVHALKKILYAPNASEVQAELKKRGDEVSSRYSQEKILPQWEAFLKKVMES
ncbi:MAG: glycosyltransferase family 4 protein [Chthoniobacterales bacterium]